MIGDGNRLFFVHIFLGQGESFFGIVYNSRNPPLIVSSLNTGSIYFSNNADASSNFYSFWLGSTHAAQA
ncbi:hypothetical protein SDC9_178885 [bioreactor metagenome]|uniref:Uncharacterized protein n=1 Tax=bioreactor metagenome TaxID=1076179 RepID=A0A645GWZ5_9ZZZZ